MKIIIRKIFFNFQLIQIYLYNHKFLLNQKLKNI